MNEHQEGTPKQRVLILCTGNSARSQMAEGLLRHMAGDRFDVASAGTHPSIVRPEAITVLDELGIDIRNHRSKSVTEFDGMAFDYVITVCSKASEECPVFPGAVRMAWDFDDPAAVTGDDEERLRAFRRTRDEIVGQLQGFLKAIENYEL